MELTDKELEIIFDALYEMSVTCYLNEEEANLFKKVEDEMTRRAQEHEAPPSLPIEGVSPFERLPGPSERAGACAGQASSPGRPAPGPGALVSLTH